MMVLWKRIALLAFGVMLLFMSVSVMTLVQIQTNALQRANEEYVERELLSFCTNVALAVEQQEREYSIAVGRSVVQYYFAAAAELLQNGGQFYSLAQEGQYLYHRGPVEPAEMSPKLQKVAKQGEMWVESVATEAAGVWVMQTNVAEKNFMIAGTTFEAGGQAFGAYFSLDVSETGQQIQRMWCIGTLILTTASVLGAMMIAALLRYELRPLGKLTETAQAIAKGDYSLRTACNTKDEIGQLSAAFDNMAQSIEEKIAYLDGEIHKRQLLVGAVSHEIRTPLTTIMGYGDTLLRMPVNEAQRIECARHIVEACKHAELTARKMMQLISLYEEKCLEKGWIPVEEMVERLKEQFGERAMFVQEVQQIYGDRTLLENLIRNLIQNALRALETEPASVSGEENVAKGIARSDTGQRNSSEKQVQVYLGAGQENVCIRVTDRGMGIEASLIHLLAEPFYRVDKTRSRKTGGVGLGLTICKLITEAHGGELSIHSTVGEGTVVEVTIAQPTI